MVNQDDHRICFIGDSFVQGTCDPECLGWAGRVSSAGRKSGYNITAYNLGIRRDTSRDILARWETECMARFNVECTRYVVFSFGANDMTLKNGSLRVPFPESIDNFSRIISKSKSIFKTLVVGPPPVGDQDQDSRIIRLCGAYAQCSEAMGVSYLPIAEPLIKNSIWMHDINSQDGTHPGAEGYGQIADLVCSWSAWWFKTKSGIK